MSPKNKNNKKNKTKEMQLLRVLLYTVFLLLILWLLLFWLVYINKAEGEKENAPREKLFFEMKTSESVSNNSTVSENASLTESNNVNVESNSHSDLQEYDEYQHAMKDILEERELTVSNLGENFGNMKSPNEVEVSHSTFGRDVLYIYHSHSRESFLPYLKDTEKPEDAFHSKGNITYVGEMLGRALERRGLGTTVDTTDIVQELENRNLDYTSSYDVSGEIMSAERAKNSNLKVFLDIHRDSLRKESTTVEMNGGNYARLLFVVGTGHKDFEKNLRFAEGLNQKISTQYPGLTKGILLKDSSTGNGIYNQDVSPNSVIVEIGGVDNTVEELHLTTEVLADVLSDYYWHN